MEVVNPIGRDFSLEEDSDYSTLATACRCSSGTGEYNKGSQKSNSKLIKTLQTIVRGKKFMTPYFL